METTLNAFTKLIEGQGLSLEKLGFRPGASAGDLARVESVIGQPLPTGLRELLSYTDGQEEGRFHFLPGCACAKLLSCEEIAHTWKLEQQMSLDSDDDPFYDLYQDGDRIRGSLHATARLIFAELPGIVVVAIDGDPGPKGKRGQVITDVSECDFVVLADSLEAYFSKIVRLMADGVLVIGYSDDYECHILRHRDDERLVEPETFIGTMD